jgi:hypothetical protein
MIYNSSYIFTYAEKRESVWGGTQDGKFIPSATRPLYLTAHFILHRI